MPFFHDTSGHGLLLPVAQQHEGQVGLARGRPVDGILKNPTVLTVCSTILRPWI